ncbi:MOSC domain-containing protein [Pseudonocardia humida]|uniref:MOSC domain-containing protein n=1 Tax=Pseudonocardia humida TaxID=2800819 RepID=A0ABT1A0U6_9PSEU|nr:MOSC domain-containing protein [Pseudonocardia humida]MCO1656627.1 MOSC domain-containing protein [Pseudonocardia humida]
MLNADAPGRIESVNRAARARYDLPARAGSTGIDKQPVIGPVRLGAGGVEGDTIVALDDHGGPDQAVYAYSVDDLRWLATEFDRSVGPGGAGENLTVSGVDCSHAVIGERWQVGGAVLQVRAARTPCRTFAGFLGVPDLVKRFIAGGRPGAYLAVVQPGTVRAGDPVRVLDRPDHGVTTADVMAARTVDRDRVPHVAAAREFLGARERAWLERVHDARVRGAAAAG